MKLQKYAAVGVDGITWHEYRTDVEQRLFDLHDRLHRGQFGPEYAAEAIYRKLLDRHPDLLPAANNLGYLLATAQAPTPLQLSEALALATKASAGGDPSALDTVGWVHYRLGDKDAALQFLRKAHESLPEDPAVTYHLARVLADLGQTGEARGLLTTLLART
ncbi:tetratricopeptide repeat protein [Desulfomicrobium apsheronum]|nr:tetratricopeptide repeat protein [Desulfomicrobium apsheronum]